MLISSAPLTLRTVRMMVSTRLTTATKIGTPVRLPSVTGVRLGRVLDDESRLPEPDEQDEQADADADRLLEVERHGVHDRFAKAADDQDRDDDALEEHDAHRGRPGEAHSRDKLEGDHRVQPHARSDGERTVRVETHQDAEEPGRETGRGHGSRERKSLAVETQNRSD